MASRRRINIAAICSSDNYQKSRVLHQEWIRKQHDQNKEVIVQITSEIQVRTHAYIMCFGKRMEITLEEAQKLSTQIKIYYE